MQGEGLAIIITLVVHVMGGAFLIWKIMPADAREELKTWFKDDGEGGTRRPVDPAPTTDGGGAEPPLADARPSSVRLREPGRLGDRLPAPARRPDHAPAPERTPAREPAER